MRTSYYFYCLLWHPSVVYHTSDLIKMQNHLKNAHGITYELLRDMTIRKHRDVLTWSWKGAELFRAVAYHRNPRTNPSFRELKNFYKKKCGCYLTDHGHESRECRRVARYDYDLYSPPIPLCEDCLVEYMDTYE